MSEILELTKRLQQQQEVDRKQIETLTQNELQKLAQNLKKSSFAELSTILDGMAIKLNRDFHQKLRPLSITLKQLNREAKLLQKVTFKSWVRSLILTATILLSISAGSWGLMQWIYKNHIHRLGILYREIDMLSSTLTQLKSRTSGVTIKEIDGDRFVVFSQGTDLTGWSVGGNPAVKLPLN